MQFSKELMKGVAEIILLQTLTEEGESYGYQLIRSIQKNSNNIFELQEGTLYPLLYRLESKGFVHSEKKISENGKERRYYAITPQGKKLLKEKTAELKIFTRGVKHIFRFSA